MRSRQDVSWTSYEFRPTPIIFQEELPFLGGGQSLEQWWADFSIVPEISDAYAKQGKPDKLSKTGAMRVLENVGADGQICRSYYSRLVVEGLQSMNDWIIFTDILSNTDLLQMDGDAR